MLRQITFLFNKDFPRARQNFKYFLTSVIDSIQRCVEIDFFFANDLYIDSLRADLEFCNGSRQGAKRNIQKYKNV